MRVLINGQTTEIPEHSSVLTMLEQAQLNDKRVAVELNGEIVAKSRHADTRLNPDDRIEIVHAIGGG
ncbi:sulfur carrier protein ThiS [Permianibacter aggregans]|uniref:Sulfur carrier protein ThiS n=1 Tax=Permianibacter aggregans TaxID=1510150 RepID=A0A4R6UT60_9GAMM|nr:sulfur carrier protein ThiS [Permianibacter aggregans]QGX40410.1 sulfur carrier protein ThiS [Permianibacter aggregans]TDQ49456.1 sulfur carrier protein ThiS [Permianibacter aggregans]